MIPPLPHNPHYVRITEQNIGTQTTTITNVSFYRYDSKWKRFRHRMISPAALMNLYTGPQLPHKAEVGGEWMASMEQLDGTE
jgi:hypothetical protein